MNKLQGNLKENFELNIKEEPDFDKKQDSKDDSNLNISKLVYRPPSDSFSSKSLHGLSKKLKRKVKFDINKRKQNILNKNNNNPENSKYLKIFQRKSFKGLNNYQSKKLVNYKANYKDFTYSESEDTGKNVKYEYPTNIINQFFFAWTIKLFRLAQKSQLKFSNLGKFSNELSAEVKAI